MNVGWYTSRVGAILLFSSIVAAQVTSTVVDLGYAKYQGTLNNQTGNVDFLGMRFADAPTGSLRWREPQLPRATPGLQKADAFPNRCWEAGQGNQATAPFPLASNPRNGQRANVEHHQQQPSRRQGGGMAIPILSEDCLFLNVHTPNSGKRKLPVVVWIHGGGYMAGSASGFSGTDIYDGADLIREAGGGIVAVIIQYRLGVFGFLPGQKVHDNGALNVGLLDQQFALQWVQRHISKFNGDPNKVTIWGESAGAGSVLQHVIANNGNTNPPLFRAAITSSTFLPSQYHFNDRIPEQLYSEVVKATGCSSSKDSLECLRNVDVDILQAAHADIGDSGFFGTFLFVPVVDGRFITKRPIQLLQEGKVNGQAVLTVTNTFEGALFVDMSTAPTIKTPEYVANLFPLFRDREVRTTSAQYKNLGKPIFQATLIMGESIFICPTYFLLRAFKDKGFKGEFAVPPGGHGNDVVYYFPHIEGPPYKNPIFVNGFAQSFLNFAMSLDPNVKWDPTNAVPRWDKWNERQRTEMLFNKTETDEPILRPTTTDDELLERCSFWESVSALSAQ